MALQGTKALETWCRSVTDGYDNVNILNMTTSWRNGLGFCAIVHKFRPELIQFDQLDPDDAFGNNELAFTVAEQHLGIPALLDPQDMVECELLDRLSILTYLSQFYQTFHGATGPSKDNTPTKLRYITSSSGCSSGSSTPSKSSRPLIMLPGKRSEPCKICSKPVFILERLNVSGRLLHRTCFKCARCNNQLSIANYYETEAGAYCCEMCPDEEVIQSEVAESNKILVQTDLNEIVGDDDAEEDEEDSLPESMQKQKDETNNNRDEIDQENNPIENEDDDDGKTPDLKIDSSEALGSSNSNVLNKKYLESEVVEEETEAGIIQAVAIKVVLDDDQIKVELEEEETVQDNNMTTTSELSDNTNLNQPQQQTDLELKLSDHDEEDDIETSDNKSEVSASGKLPSNKEETAETGSDDKVEEASGENFNSIITDEEIPMEEKNSLKNLTENVAKVKLEEEEWPECDQANIDNQISDAKELEGEKESAAAEMVMEDQEESYPQDLNPFGSDNEMKKSSTNPFGSESDSQDEDEKPETEIKQRTEFPPPKPPRLSLNPFGSDFEDGSDDEEIKKKARKKRPAPLPPSAVSKVAPTTPQPAPRISLRPPPRPPPPKSQKDQDNLYRRSMNQADDEIKTKEPDEVKLTPLSPDKSSMDGQWKKKKGPAPPRPIPPKRQVKKLPRKAVNNELMEIEIKQQEYERQGVDLEKTIREICVKSDNKREEAGLDNNDRDSLGPEAEDLIVQMFELVNEKNELFRRQTELMYMKKEHRLEEEHADIEHQIRVLMAKPDALRTDDDKVLEDKLIDRLMAIVTNRNEIVDCLEMDRLRELEEDESIEIHLGEYAAIKPPDEEEMAKKKKETKKKEKKKKKKDKAYDADKDIDTSEFPSGGASLSNSPRPSPKKSPLVSLTDKEKTKKLKKKLLSTLKPISIKR